jgi:two-component system response regulator AtoC
VLLTFRRKIVFRRNAKFGGKWNVQERNGAVWGVGELPPEEVVFGRSEPMRAIRQKVQKVASTDLPILIQGENGTGKEVVARHIHANSVWGQGPFVKVSCAAIPGTLLESELFGYEQGAFTGANTAKEGWVEQAEGGTLFLDEIAEIALGLQAKLLQVLQDGRFMRIGGHEEKRVVTRVICATSRQIEQEIMARRFRADLFYRINVIFLKLPQLCERREDLPALVDYFLSLYATRLQRLAPALSPESWQSLQRHDWPGNIRELENCVARCVILGSEDALRSALREKKSRPFPLEADNDGSIPFKRISDDARRKMEHDLILKTLEANHWNRRGTAKALNISYRALLYKVRQAGLPSRGPRKKSDLSPVTSSQQDALSD